ncbi:oxygenase MpaB family protein [Gordonia sp. NPDC003429]
MQPITAVTSSYAARLGGRRRERYRLRTELSAVDPSEDPRAFAERLSTLEFPWGSQQALSFALFRTYAVPSIGELLYRTGEFTDHTQKRYDDTALLLSEPVEHGFDAGTRGRAAVRRINQMHAMYDIPNDDMLYVLATFVVCPVRWVAQHEWRPLTDQETAGITNFYRMLGKHMGVRDIPESYDDFERLLTDFEREHFAYSAGGRAVADATLGLLTTFMPYRLLPPPVVRRMAFALMDEPLLDAFGYPRPTRLERVLVTAGVRVRALAIRFLATPRSTPVYGRDMPEVCGYPNGYRVEDLGTFARKCPHP